MSEVISFVLIIDSIYIYLTTVLADLIRMSGNRNLVYYIWGYIDLLIMVPTTTIVYRNTINMSNIDGT